MKNSVRSENRRKSLNSIGLSSLLVIFVVLASVTLSVMCLITVRQDLDRAKKLAVTHEEYYSPTLRRPKSSTAFISFLQMTV